MAHKTLIGGTAYEISGGKALIGGTAYSIAKGKTLVGGTAYEIVFASPITVNLLGNGNNNGCYATINGTKYYSAATVECEAGTELSFYAWGSTTMGKKNSKITCNGTQVAAGTTSAAASYTFIPEASVVNATFAAGSSGSWVITITTE